MDKDAEIARLKASCNELKAKLEIFEKRSFSLGDALHVLTAQRHARLHWLYRLGDLHVRIPEATRIEIGDIIDEAYENWQKECDEGRKSDLSTNDGGNASD